MNYDPVIKICNLKKVLSSKQLFQNFNLSLHEGQTYGIVGPNGSGKTTLLKLICGLILPDKGTIEICGYDIQKSRIKVMEKIGAVFEGSRNLYWRLSGWQNLIYFGGLRGVFGRALRTNAEILLKELKLWNAKDTPVQNFSRGMQQKLAIICAFISDPDLLILDEPTLALDSSSQKIFAQWIERITQEKGKTVIMTSHQHHTVKSLCHQVITLTPRLQNIRKEDLINV